MEENKQQIETEEKIIVNKKSKTRFFVVLTVAVIAFIITYIIFRGTYLETLEIGENYISVFWQNVKHMSITIAINFVVVYFMVYITNLKIKKGLKEFFEQEKRIMPKLINKSVAFIAAILVSAFTSNILFEKAMLCFNNAQFGIQDPIFGLDIGYFVFQKPFIELLIWYFLIAGIVLLIYTATYYITVFNMFFDGVDKRTLKRSQLLKQVTTLTMIITILISVLIFIKTQDIGSEKFLTLKSEQATYSLYGAGFIDVTIKLWGYRLLSLVIIYSVHLIIKYLKQRNRKKVLISIAIVPIYLVILFFVLVLAQAILVTGNELDKEKIYIENNIKYTKNAYGVDIEEVSIQTSEPITNKDITTYENVLNNINLVNSDVVLKDLKSGQTAKGYYTYTNAKIGKYLINGKEQLVYISPREILSSTGTYNNKTYEYTHGYSAIVTSASTTDTNGNLNHIQKGFNKSDDVLPVTEPRIYFGMQTNDTVVVNSKDKKEFDYPILDSTTAENAENVYDGEAGLKLNTLDRMILAFSNGDINLAFSNNINENSKILTNRNVIERAKKIMPYLTYDNSPYLVVTNDGNLVWVIDAYTTSKYYPYSQKTTVNGQEINYIKNSVKVLVDAYDGTVKFYITDRTDPIAMAYRNIYPDLFVSLEESIPTNISEHFVYSEYLYKIQSEIVARYHNIKPDVLYRNNDIWEIASHNTGKVITKKGTQIDPYYTMIKTPDESKEKLGLILPYTPEGRQNLISYLVGTCDNEGNSKLTIYKYEADSNILGPMQLDTQLEQDETIVKELESLNISGTKMSKDIIMVPLDNTILYVEPIYIQYLNENDSLPTLKKVIVASGNKVAIGDNLKQALTKLFSQNAVNIQIENTDTIEDLINTIIKANNNLTKSNDSNNWEMMGKDVQKLQELIEKLEKLVEEDKVKNKNNLSTSEYENVLTNEII